MMTATWRGTTPLPRISASRSSAMLDLHDLRFLRLDRLVHQLEALVVQLLDVLFGVLLLVLGDVLGLLGATDRLGARVPHRHASFLGELVHHLHQLATPLFGERRQRNADQVAVGGGGHCTMVPTRSPAKTLAVAPGWLMLNTTMGSLFSLHNPNALASITA